MPTAVTFYRPLNKKVRRDTVLDITACPGLKIPGLTL